MDCQDPFAAFEEAAIAKHQAGVAEYRNGDHSMPFQGDLRTEFEEERLDGFNYLREMLLTGIIRDDEFRYAAESLAEFWVWMRTNVRKRTAESSPKGLVKGEKS